MRCSIAALVFLGAVSLVSAAPTAKRAAPVTDLPDSLPFPSPEQLMAIQRKARGTLPNVSLPDTVSEGGIKSFKLIAFNEFLEIAFFTQLLLNITDNVPGYEFSNEAEREHAISSLSVIQGQEEIYAISANAVLENVGVIASVIGEEGEQLGWYRLRQGKVPSELPLLTASTLSFAFAAEQLLTVPGTRPNKDDIPFMTFDPLTIVTPPGPETQIITALFPVDSDMKANGHLFMTYINQRNIPVTVPLRIDSVLDDMVVAKALFPYDEHVLNEFTIAAVTRGDGSFPNAVAVAQSTVAGPGLIVVK